MNRKHWIGYSLVLGALLGVSCRSGEKTPRLIGEQDTIVRFEVVACADTVIHRGSPGTEEIFYGLEGGRVVKLGSTYHMMTAEMVGEPYCVNMRLGHWCSADGISWQRLGTIRQSDGDFTGTSQRAAVWGPMPVFHQEDNRWHLFYVCYKGKPSEPDKSNAGFDGVIQHAVSDTEGIEGFGGPYTDLEIILRYDVDPDSWEGHQGVDSFFPYQIGDTWYGFYGSATTQQMSTCQWQVGLARAERIEGPWSRMSDRNPVDLRSFAENPIVSRLDNGVYIAIVDGGPWVNKMGYTLSWDGVNWCPLRHFELEPAVKKWWRMMRTPLSLIPEEDGTYTMFFTAFKDDAQGMFGTLSKLSLKATFVEEKAR